MGLKLQAYSSCVWRNERWVQCNFLLRITFLGLFKEGATRASLVKTFEVDWWADIFLQWLRESSKRQSWEERLCTILCLWCLCGIWWALAGCGHWIILWSLNRAVLPTLTNTMTTHFMASSLQCNLEIDWPMTNTTTLVLITVNMEIKFIQNFWISGCFIRSHTSTVHLNHWYWSRV